MVLTAFLSGARQENVKHAEFPVDQPSAIAFTAFADAWCSARNGDRPPFAPWEGERTFDFMP